MDFLKRHLFYILSALGGAAGIALGITGLQAMPKVLEEMKRAESMFQSLESLQSRPVNKDVIEAEERRIQAVLDDRNKMLEQAQTMYAGMTPLVEGVFPDGPPLKRIEFRTAYNAAMRDLLSALNSGGPATAADVELMRRKIEDERAEVARFGGGAGDGKLAEELSGEPRNSAGILTRAGVRQDSKVRADIQAAQRISCYAVPWWDEKINERVSSLDFYPTLKDTGTVDAPYPEDIWRAQVGYWIQRHIVNAIVELNKSAAEAAKAEGKDPWVGNMPVKDLISIRFGSGLYVPPEGELYAVPEAGGYLAALPAGTAETVFTHTASGPFFEAVQIAVKMVMDQRDITALIEKITNNSFFTLVRVAYKEVPPNVSLVGKIYGSEPTVNVLLEFEFVMLGETFRKWMPREVCEKYVIPCPEPAPAGNQP